MTVLCYHLTEEQKRRIRWIRRQNIETQNDPPSEKDDKPMKNIPDWALMLLLGIFLLCLSYGIAVNMPPRDTPNPLLGIWMGLLSLATGFTSFVAFGFTVDNFIKYRNQ